MRTRRIETQLQTTKKGRARPQPRSEVLPIAQLRPYRRNARKHSARQIRQIADSIEHFGFTNPVLVDEVDRIIAGHGRVAAARLLGRTEVPVVRLSHLTDLEKRAYVIADNRLAEKAGWDAELLAIELGELSTLVTDAFELTITGFEAFELHTLIGGVKQRKTRDREARETSSSVSRPGDTWLLGPHRLACGAPDRDEHRDHKLEDVDAAIRCWQRFTGCNAVLDETGQIFDEAASERSNGASRAGPKLRALDDAARPRKRPSVQGGRK